MEVFHEIGLMSANLNILRKVRITSQINSTKHTLQIVRSLACLVQEWFSTEYILSYFTDKNSGLACAWPSTLGAVFGGLLTLSADFSLVHWTPTRLPIGWLMVTMWESGPSKLCRMQKERLFSLGLVTRNHCPIFLPTFKQGTNIKYYLI